MDVLYCDKELFLISLDEEGDNFQDVLQQQRVLNEKVDPEYIQNLDPISTSALILTAILINPEDGKADNYQIRYDYFRNGMKVAE